MKTTLMITLMAFGVSAFANSTSNGQKSYSNSNQVSYPMDALESYDEGTVLIYFEITNGTATNVKVQHSISASLDQAAMNVLENKSAEYFKNLESTGKSSFVLPVLFDIR